MADGTASWSYVVTGLTAGKSYYVRVLAYNAQGYSVPAQAVPTGASHYEVQAADKSIDLLVSFDPTMPRIICNDPVKIEQILYKQLFS